MRGVHTQIDSRRENDKPVHDQSFYAEPSVSGSGNDRNQNRLISVIVPVFNVEQFLEKCIQSILNQTYRNFELLLIDDGSTDRSGRICDDFGDPRITVIHQRNIGLSSARNKGLDLMKGDLVAFVDADDTVTPDYLEYLLSLFSCCPECAITACNHYIVRGGRRKPNAHCTEEISILTEREAMEEAMFHRRMNVSAWAKMYRREVFDHLRFPEGILYEDTWLFGDLMKQTSKVVWGGRCCYFYEVRDQSIVNSAFSEAKLRYIDSVQKMISDARDQGVDVSVSGPRRLNHARMSTLRYMENSSPEYAELKNRLREEILADAPKYISDSRTPLRDKIGVRLLRISLKAYYMGWRAYSRLR